LDEWLGVDKVELAVMTELLLRGDQTVGELRGRASRMEPIADLAALKIVLDSLRSKGLVTALTSEGRGQVVSHALYKPREIEALRAKYLRGGPADPLDKELPPATTATCRAAPAPQTSAVTDGREIAATSRELASLGQRVGQLERELEEVRDQQRRTEEELRQLKDSLGG
jgi:uncharacterized protein